MCQVPAYMLSAEKLVKLYKIIQQMWWTPVWVYIYCAFYFTNLTCLLKVKLLVSLVFPNGINYQNTKKALLHYYIYTQNSLCSIQPQKYEVDAFSKEWHICQSKIMNTVLSFQIIVIHTQNCTKNCPLPKLMMSLKNAQ